MANFTTEQAVRDAFQLTDTTLVPATLVEQSIDDAHTEILRRLDAAYDVPSPAAALVLGETLLAGARLLRSLAAKSANEMKDLSIGGKRVESGKRFEALHDAADSAEQEAWKHLEPYMLARSPRSVLIVTDSTPVLGEE